MEISPKWRWAPGLWRRLSADPTLVDILTGLPGGSPPSAAPGANNFLVSDEEASRRRWSPDG